MRSFLGLAPLLATASIGLASALHLEIPEVRHRVEDTLRDYPSYNQHYSPPSNGQPPPYPHHPGSSSGPHSKRPRPTGSPGPPKSDSCSYWLEDVKHQGLAAFNPNPSSYQVFRNVKDFGAKGDGETDDTDAINSAISTGDRCEAGECNSTTTTPAIVYFPPGVYSISDSIIDYYYTQIIGNPNCLPTIRATSDFNGTLAIIDADPYGANGKLSVLSTNIFFRSIRNLILDLTDLPVNSTVAGIHWPTGQATSLQNIVFQMSQHNGTGHRGIFIEEGSGGFMNDLVFYGGASGAFFGNQQFTMRNLTFYNAVTAITQAWDWGWTYKNVNIYNCSIGLNMSSGGHDAQNVGSITFIDSSITNTKIGVLTAHDKTSLPASGGSLILENVKLSNVRTAVQGPNGTTALAGSSGNTTIAAWGQGHSYTPNGPNNFQGPISPNKRPAGLLSSNGKFYERSKPQYANIPASNFVSARSAGAKGDGKTDDTKALQQAIDTAKDQKKILFIDHGDYIVTSTIYIPAGSRITGESFPVILSQGSYFNDINKPKPVVQIGKEGETGSIEWTDTIVSTKGQQRGAVLFEYNLYSPSKSPSGLWDVHARVGGFAGSDLQLEQCPTTPKTNVTSSNLEEKCIAAYLTFHLTKSSGGAYLENVWLWVADHDIEDAPNTQITVYAGRGLLVESEKGNNWFVGTSVEHHVKYEYQFVNTKDVFAGQIQTETAYYQPNPSAPLPFPYVASLSDPKFPAPYSGRNTSIPNANGWGLRVVDSEDILVYGAGLYSFFNNYSTNCSAIGQGEACQTHIFSVEGNKTAGAVSLYNLNTVGTNKMITVNGREVANYEDNLNGFVDTVALFRS